MRGFLSASSHRASSPPNLTALVHVAGASLYLRLEIWE